MTISRRLLLESLLAASLLLATRLEAQEAHVQWTYEHPESWAGIDPAYSLCASGQNQSPIDLQNSSAAHLPVLTLDYKLAPLTVTDNGHTIQVNYPPGSTAKVGKNVYTLQQFHFHHPAEERIGRITFPLDAHFVHVNDAGHITVIAVLFDIGTANSVFDVILKNVPRVKEKQESVPSATIRAEDLLPDSHAYVTFSGSLTTPPCTEGVTWYVLQHHMTISTEQLNNFAKLYPMNARPIQPANGRRVLMSR